MWKKASVWLLVLILAMSIFAVGCGSGGNNGNGDAGEDQEPVSDDTSLSDIQAKGKLIIGCDDAFPPMGFQDEATGEIVGFDIDLAKAVAEALGVELEIKPINWDTKELELKNKNIDVIWNGYTINASRNKQVEFTKPYLNNAQAIVVPIGSDIQTKADLAGKIIGAQVESSGLAALTKDQKIVDAAAEIKEYDTYQEALLDLTTSRLDAVVVDTILIEYSISQAPNTYRVLEENMGEEYYGIGCPKGAEALRIAIDEALDALMEDGTVDEICNKWFGENIVIRDIDKLTQEEIEAQFGTE